MVVREGTHGHIVPGTVGVVLDVQVREVEENPMALVHRDDPRAVHIVGIVVGVRRGVDLSAWGGHMTTAA